MILLSDESFFSTEFKGDKASGTLKGLLVKGPMIALWDFSWSMYESITSGKLTAPLWFCGHVVE